MAYVESLGVMHRDLKPSNIFMSGTSCAVIADFGLARYCSLNENEKTPTGGMDTYIYMAPEVIVSSSYDNKCAIFSFGILLNELMDRKVPYSGSYYTIAQIAQAVADQNLRPKLCTNPPHSGESLHKNFPLLNNMVTRCWQKDPNGRPMFREVLKELDSIMTSLDIDDSPESLSDENNEEGYGGNIQRRLNKFFETFL